jgi:RHS repeat-associated protein
VPRRRAPSNLDAALAPLLDDGGRPLRESAVGNPYLFTGRRLDRSGLYYFRDRYLDPALGRFLRRDRWSDPLNSGNLYSYAGLDPLIHVDPWGMSGKEWGFDPSAAGTAGKHMLIGAGKKIVGFLDFVGQLMIGPVLAPEEFTEKTGNVAKSVGKGVVLAVIAPHELFINWQEGGRKKWRNMKMEDWIEQELGGLPIDAAGAFLGAAFPGGVARVQDLVEEAMKGAKGAMRSWGSRSAPGAAARPLRRGGAADGFDGRSGNRAVHSFDPDNPGSWPDLNPTRHSDNCLDVVQRGVDVLRGGPAVPARALSRWQIVGAKKSGKEYLQDIYQGKFQTITGGRSEIEGILKARGPGSQGIVYVRKGKNYEHVFNAANIDGKAVFPDFQVNRQAPWRAYEIIDDIEISFLPVD